MESRYLEVPLQSKFLPSHGTSVPGTHAASQAPKKSFPRRSLTSAAKAAIQDRAGYRSGEPLRHPKSSAISTFPQPIPAWPAATQFPIRLQNETPVSLWGRSHLGTTPHISLTQFENQAYRSYVIQVFSSA
jgi:hypothetical protein